MSRKKTPQNLSENSDNSAENSTQVYFFMATGALVLAAVALLLAFVTVLGIYALIASALLELAAISFLTTQKKKNNFKAVFYVTAATYVLLGITTMVFVGGLIYSAVATS